jgi:hypothetical protein
MSGQYVDSFESGQWAEGVGFAPANPAERRDLRGCSRRQARVLHVPWFTHQMDERVERILREALHTSDQRGVSRPRITDLSAEDRNRLALATLVFAPHVGLARSDRIWLPSVAGGCQGVRSGTPVRVRRRWSASRPFVRWGAAC